jgi:hypothetical protein
MYEAAKVYFPRRKKCSQAKIVRIRFVDDIVDDGNSTFSSASVEISRPEEGETEEGKIVRVPV